MDKNVVVYSSDNCPWCKKLKDFLEQNSVKFVEKDVAADQAAAMEMVQKSGKQGIPVTDINGKIIIGFNRDAIVAELGI